jgi:hypothetical protein
MIVYNAWNGSKPWHIVTQGDGDCSNERGMELRDQTATTS